MKNSLVVRWGLGAMLAGAALPLTAGAQTAPAPAAPPMAAPEPTPVPPPPTPVVEAAPASVTPAPAELPPAAAAVEVTPPPVDAPAEEAAAPGLAAPTINGYVEAGYHVNFSEKRTTAPVPLRVYDPAGNSFALHAAHIAITQKFSDTISAVVEIDAGRDALADTGTAYPWTSKQQALQLGFDVQEAYANYASGIFTLTAGKFVTYEGIEVIEGPLNPTITRGFLFGWAEPFTHTGVKAHFQLASAVNFGIGIVNGWDKLTDDNQGKTGIARLAFFTPTDPFFAAISGSVGPEQTGNSKNQRVSVDLTGAITPSAAFSLWYQFNIGTEKNVPLADGPMTGTWWGFGLQPVVTAGDFSLGGRLEYFSDAKGIRTGLPGKYFNITVTPGIKLVDTFKLRAEFRADIASAAVLGKASDPGKSQFTGALSAEYSF